MDSEKEMGKTGDNNFTFKDSKVIDYDIDIGKLHLVGVFVFYIYEQFIPLILF
ncbi:hypothetical protein [Oceanobacillus sp. 1P07AA]|uniref:hypothetical protein n=1 Tax=Oceanobacillus sp. 1P07AA TaxID=3132293 RepID=UPI0039A58C3A